MKKKLKFVMFNEGFYKIIEASFKKFIEPLYGDQSSALKKILYRIDRNCELLFLNDFPVGFLIYKTSLQNEFGLKNAFELKTVLLFDSFKNIGLGSLIFNHAETLAYKYHATSIYASVSQNLPRVIQYLKKKEWLIIGEKKSDDNFVDTMIMMKWLS